MKAAIEYAIANKRRSVTLVHKGNIMKYTEGYFCKWGYETAKKYFAGETVTWDECGGNPPAGKILIKDAIADSFLQQVLLRPKDYDVVATLNLNGDYLSDARWPHRWAALALHRAQTSTTRMAALFSKRRMAPRLSMRGSTR